MPQPPLERCTRRQRVERRVQLAEREMRPLLARPGPVVDDVRAEVFVEPGDEPEQDLPLDVYAGGDDLAAVGHDTLWHVDRLNRDLVRLELE